MALGADALRILKNPESDPLEATIALINAISSQIPDASLLVIDDFQYVNDSDSILHIMDWFIEHLPRSLHVIFPRERPSAFPRSTGGLPRVPCLF